MVVNKINIISSSVIVNEGLKTIIQQLTANNIIEDFLDWNEFLDNFDKKIPNQTIFVEIISLPEKDRLNSLKYIVNNNVTVILIYSKNNEVENFDDFVSIPINISKEKLTAKLKELVLTGEQNKPNDNVLSERETTILKEVALGLTNKEISDKLYISMHTVITHRKNITAKLGIKTISGLTVYALINNIISPISLKQ